MSQENVELARRAHDAFNRRDLDDFLSIMDPSVELTPYERFVQGAGPYRGHGGIRTWWKETFDVIPDFTVELDELRDLGGELVWASGRVHGHGAGSNAPFERPYWGVAQFRGGKQVWWSVFESEAEALEAARLRK